MQGDFSQKLTWLSLLKLLDLPSSKYNFLGKNYLYQIFVKMPLFQWHSPIFMISIVLWRCIRIYIYLAFNIGSLFVDQVCAAVCTARPILAAWAEISSLHSNLVLSHSVSYTDTDHTILTKHPEVFHIHQGSTCRNAWLHKGVPDIPQFVYQST